VDQARYPGPASLSSLLRDYVDVESKVLRTSKQGVSKRLLAYAKYLISMFARLETDLGWGPDYGPFSYTLLPEPHLESELRRLSGLDTPCEGVDVVSFQPCPDPTVRNEDRWAAEVWDMPGGRWTFLGVFDGTESCARAGFKH
jgi:hypothetical protein